MTALEKNLPKNIQKLRRSAGLTQRELGERVGYSEKTVSKWETGTCTPCIEVLLQLAELFSTGLDALFRDEDKIYYLGIDGGGTKTELELTDAQGNVLRHLITDGSNPFDIGMEAAQEVLRSAIHSICSGFSLANVSLFAGLAGGSVGNSPAELRRFFGEFGFAAFDSGSDNKNIVAAGLGGEDGIALILGTGICAYRSRGGETDQIAGWGYLIDEGGSAYNIGRDGIAAVYRQHDGSGPKTTLSEMILQQVGEKGLSGLLTDVYARGKRYIASFSATVFDAAEQGDAVAQAIVERNIRIATHIIDTAIAPFPKDMVVPVVLAGGLTKRPQLVPLMQQAVSDPSRCHISCLDKAPVKGAVMLARQLCPR